MVDEKLKKALKKSMLFAEFTEEDQRALLDVAIKRIFPKNCSLFGEGEEARGFYLVVSGKVKIFKISPDGKEHILHIFGPGEPIGEVAVFSGKDFPASADTLQESVLLYFPRTAFLNLAVQQPQILLNMLATLSMRLRRFAQKIERLSLKEVASRLAEVLLEMAQDLSAEKNGSPTVELKITKGQLASQIGTSPETLSRTFKKMTRLGLIEVNRKHVVLMDIVGLKELASGENQP